jgi:large repetitive protein
LPCTSPVELVALPAGPHTFEVRAADTVGNVGPVASFEWEVDLDAPTVTVTSGPPALTNQDSAELSFDFEPGSTTVCSLDGGDPEPCASPVAYEELEDGEHSFVVQATDSALHVATDTYSWTVDTAAPPAAIESGPPALTSLTSAEIAFSSEDPGAGFECRLDSGEELDFQPCASPESLSGLDDRAHELEVRAVDAAGNAGPPASHTWTVDTTAPTADIIAAPNAAVAHNTAQFGFTSNEPGSSFSCRIDTGDFQPCSAPQDYSGLGDGPHSFEVKATDPVGNTGVVDSHAWSIDTAAPTVTFDNGPDFLDDEKIVTVATAAFDFHASEPGSSFQCRLDSGQPADFVACSSPKAYEGLSDGPHTLEVRATDQLGNQGPAAAYAWNSDIVAPTVSFDGGPSGQTGSDAAEFTFHASEAGDFECRLDGSGDDPYEACASPHSYEDLSEGPHKFELLFTDAGDREATASRTWTVDTIAPEVDITGGPTGTVTSSLASLTFTVSGGGPAQCSWDGGSFSGCSSPASRSGLGDGPHSLVVRSTDGAGNEGTDSRSWTVDRTPPQTNLVSGPPATTSTGDATLTFSADDPDSVFQCSLDGAVFATCSSPQTYSGLGSGDHSFRVRAVDQVGNTDLSPASAAWRVEPPAAGAVQGETGKKPKCSKKGKKKKRKGARKCKRSR